MVIGDSVSERTISEAKMLMDRLGRRIECWTVDNFIYSRIPRYAVGSR
jgi:hypothetical protein